MILKKMHGYPSHHEYLRDSLASKYVECFSCKKRNLFACVKCKYCWSCHWKKEKEGDGKKSTNHVNSCSICKITTLYSSI